MERGADQGRRMARLVEGLRVQCEGVGGQTKKLQNRGSTWVRMVRESGAGPSRADSEQVRDTPQGVPGYMEQSAVTKSVTSPVSQRAEGPHRLLDHGQLLAHDCPSQSLSSCCGCIFLPPKSH